MFGKIGFFELLILGMYVIVPVTVVIVIVVLSKRAAARSKEITARSDSLRTEAEMEKRKALTWFCPSCGKNNYNREVCEACGTEKPVIHREQ